MGGHSRDARGHNYKGKHFDPNFHKRNKSNDDSRKRSRSNDDNENVRKPKKSREKEDLIEPKEKLDEAHKLMKKQLERNLKENKSTSSNFASKPASHDHGECPQENIAPNLVKIDKTRVMDISLSKEDLANIGQGRLRTTSERDTENQSRPDHPFPCAKGRSKPEDKIKPKQRLAGEPTQKKGENAKKSKDKTEKRKEKTKESINSPVRSPNTVVKEKEKVDLSKFKESLVKMDPSHLRDLIENPRNARPIVRKNFEELIKRHREIARKMLDKEALKCLRDSGYCNEDDSPETIDIDTSDNNVFVIFSNFIKQEVPDIESFIKPDVPDIGNDSVAMEIKCEPGAMHFESSDENIDDQMSQECGVSPPPTPADLRPPPMPAEVDTLLKTFETVSGLSNSTFLPKPVPVPNPTDSPVNNNTSDNDESVAFAPPNQKRKKGRPKKGEERIIGGTETVIGLITDPDVEASTLEIDLPTPPHSSPPRQSLCPIDPDTHTGDISSCIRDVNDEPLTEGNVEEDLQRIDEAADTSNVNETNDHLAPGPGAHFLATSDDNIIANTDRSSVSSSTKKIPTPNKKNSVARILEGKLEELKIVFKKEARATHELEDIDKQIDKLMKDRKKKLAELKHIQKEKSDIMRA